uniref:Tetratricopeptide repeat protein 30 n=1 Tax=Meloidogyne hapla TaxID=6305 RepID=A0A1I8BXD3_MELHA
MAPIKDGEFTSTIYGMIRDNKFTDAMRVLQYEVQRNSESRAALSLLGYCYYYIQDYIMAAECYEKLSELYPQHTDYRLYHAQALYNAYMFPEAVSVLALINDPKMEKKVVKLDAAIKYREEDLQNARILVEQFDSDDPDIEVNLACLDLKEGKPAEALKRVMAATEQQSVDDTSGYQNQLTYSIALCHYQMRNFPQALSMISEIIDRAVKDHPELGIGMAAEEANGGAPLRSVGNTLQLNESAVIEACSLKFAIEYQMKNMDAAAEALLDMPARAEEELDPVTLHNQALIGVETNLADSFSKLQYLLGHNPFPPETFANLLLLYCKYEYYDLAADVLAENGEYLLLICKINFYILAHLTYKMLSQYQFDYLDALITLQSSESDAYSKFDTLSNSRLTELRKRHQRLQEIRENDGSSSTTIDIRSLQQAIDSVEQTMEEFLPALLAQAKLLWDKSQWSLIERLFRRSAEFCSGNDIWKLNLAHVLFMQEKFKEASDCYAPLVRANFDKMLQVSAIVLANLCVCYIMTNSNEEAEEIMKRVEREENGISDKKSFHLSIIIIIGTLYCAKSNYEFGISRIVRALEPCERKLGVDTWFYSKRCLASMMENIAKCVIVIRDDVLIECLQFLEACEVHGHEIPTEANLFGVRPGEIVRMVSHEARLLRALLLQLMDY